ncbi:hypothetical protein AAFC00_007192 [Neodothiora populina]|uniref:Protein BCP1 n=1 Tax=Neodothiora populina TaxID=2781224 RepID=A0ABR3PHQ8_9PEZI
MSKRKAAGQDAPPKDHKMRDNDDESSSDDDEDMLDVDFEWFDPQPAVDFHGLKTLLRQLLDVDNVLFDMSPLSDLILSQPLLGSTVKVDGNETDPFAFLTVLNLHQHKDKPVIQALTRYIASKAATVPSLADTLPKLLEDDTKQVGLILTERFINMPSEIITPCYTMLQEEIQWALDEKEPYDFTHYLILSKTYQEVDSKLDAEENRPSKKNKKQSAPETFYFHPEDEKLHEFSLGFGNFDYEKATDEGASDAKRAFQEAGIKPMGHLTLIEGRRFADAITGVGEYLSGGGA